MMNLVPIIADSISALIAASSKRACYRFVEFFVSNIRNPHTRRAYAGAVQEFLAWCERHGVTSIAEVPPLYVGTGETYPNLANFVRAMGPWPKRHVFWAIPRFASRRA